MSRLPEIDLRALSPIVEDLEARLMLAGNVDIVVSSAGDLLLRGDFTDNEIEVSLSGNTILVQGLSGTAVTMNRITALSHSIQLGTPHALRDVKVIMQGGNDRVVLRDLTIGRNLLVLGGTGSDTIRTNRLFVGARATLDLGTSSDPSAAESTQIEWTTVATDLTVRVRSGTADVNVVDSQAHGSTKILTGRNDDHVVIERFDTGGNLLVHSQFGHDQVHLTEVTNRGSISIRTGAGFDLVSLQNMSDLHNIAIDSGHDSDFVTLTNVTNVVGVTLKLGSGNDTAKIKNSEDLYGVDVFAAQGNDDFEMVSSHRISDVFLNMSAGNDEIRLDDSSTLGSFVTLLGAGNDSCSSMSCSFDGSLKLYGGSGFDEFSSVGSLMPTYPAPVMVGVEVIAS